MMQPLVHYHAPNTRSSTTLWLFEELGVPHERRVLNMKKEEHKAPAYLAINPMGKVPTVVHGQTVITEAAAIAIYLADLFPEAKLAPALSDSDRGTFLRWIVFNQAAVEPAVTDLALKRTPGQSSMMSYGTYDTTVDVLAAALRPGPYLLGKRFSAADIVAGSGLRWMLLFKLLPDRKEFVDYVARLSERPALQRATALDQKIAAELAL